MARNLATPSATGDLARLPTETELKASLRLLFSSFPTQNRDNPEQSVAGYVVALRDYPAAAIQAGIVKLVRGDFPEHDGKWLPSTAIVGRAVKAEAESGKIGEAVQWQRRLERFAATGEWNPHWGQGPDSPSFQHICPPHLLAAFCVKKIA